MRLLIIMGMLALAAQATPATAGSVECNGSNETKLSWPADNPVWEMCWLRPSHSAGPQGSGLELRKVHYRGHSVLKTAHSPLLFAEYASSTCYRDWKDANNPFVAEPQVRNQLGIIEEFTATTSCDRSLSPTQSYGQCPYQLPGMTGADCFSGVAIEDMGDHVVLTTHYEAAWYAYTSRAIFYADGAFDMVFGFGNFNNSSNGTTHWHHNYWRLDFDIDTAEDNVLSINDVPQATEFFSLRDPTGGPGGVERTWEVRNSKTGRGYRITPSALDYVTPTNQSGRGFHLTDVIGTVYKPGEYGDLANNPLGACGMSHGNLANGENIGGTAGEGADVVVYYRSAVRDQAGIDAMLCKSAGPMFVPLGDWGAPEAANLSVTAQAQPDPVAAGGTLDFSIEVASVGPATVSDLVVELELPPELSYVGLRASRGTTWSCEQAGAVVACAMTAGELAAGGDVFLQVQTLVDVAAEPGEIETLVGAASAEIGDPEPANNQVTVSTTVVPGEPLDRVFAHDFECSAKAPGCIDNRD